MFREGEQATREKTVQYVERVHPVLVNASALCIAGHYSALKMEAARFYAR